MTRHLVSTLAAAAIAVGLIVGAPGAASANARTETDVRGDAPARLDVTKVGFRYNATGAHAAVHVRDLRLAGEFVFVVMNRRHTVRFGLAVTGHRDGSRTSRFYRYRHGDIAHQACHGSRVRWRVGRDVVSMSFPKRCFGALGPRVAFAVGSTHGFPHGTTVDEGPVARLHAPRHREAGRARG